MGTKPTYIGIVFLLIISLVKDFLKLKSSTSVEGRTLQYNSPPNALERVKRNATAFNTKLLPQTNPNVPLVIETDVYIEDINTFNAVDMDFRLDFFLWQRWTVSREVCEQYVNRLEHLRVDLDEEEELLIPLKIMNTFWVPDTYITNAKTASTPSNIPPTKYMRITTSKNICQLVYALRLAGKMACQMDFKDYPLDIQYCPITFRSFSHSNVEVAYKWYDDKPPRLNPEVLMLQHHILISKSQITREIFRMNHSALIVNLQFIRNLDYYLIQVYTPSTLVVILSWFNFWLGLDIMAGRISLSVTSLLSLVTQFASVRKDLPPVSYVNGIDIWMVTCIGFVIGSLLEFTFVRFVGQMKKDELAKMESKSGIKKKKSSHRNKISWARRFLLSRNLDASIDNISRGLFPGGFLLFNLIYWPMLFNRNF